MPAPRRPGARSSGRRRRWSGRCAELDGVRRDAGPAPPVGAVRQVRGWGIPGRSSPRWTGPGSTPASRSRPTDRLEVRRRSADEDLPLVQVGNQPFEHGAGSAGRWSPRQVGSAGIGPRRRGDRMSGPAACICSSSCTEDDVGRGARAVHEHDVVGVRQVVEGPGHGHHRRDTAAAGQEQVRVAGCATMEKSPSGPETPDGCAELRWSCSQFDIGPPGMRFTVIASEVRAGRRRGDRVAALQRHRRRGVDGDREVLARVEAEEPAPRCGRTRRSPRRASPAGHRCTPAAPRRGRPAAPVRRGRRPRSLVDLLEEPVDVPGAERSTWYSLGA